MANLLHRLLRPRAGESPEIDEVRQPERPEPLESAEPEPVAEREERPDAAAKPKAAAKGPRKTRDEISTIGPGEP